MIHNILGQKLRPILNAEAALRRRQALSVVLLVGTIIALSLLLAAKLNDFWSWPLVIGTAIGVILAAMIALWVADSRRTSVKEIADRIEEENPDLQTALITAVEQQPGPDGELGYLQEKVVFEAVNHALKNNWVRQISRSRLLKAGTVQMLAAVVFFIAMFGLLHENNRLLQIAKTQEKEAEIPAEETKPDPLADYEITVNPGNAEVERGSNLIVEAKFGDRIPPRATVVISDPGPEGTERGRVPLKPGLDEQVFAGMLTKIDSDAVYRVDFDEEHSDDFTITTFVHPKLEQADATITPPDYTEQEPKKIEDTRKVSLLEGSDLAWSIKINKAVKDAELFSVDTDSIIPLKPSANDPTVLMASHVPESTAKYRLHLVDDRERSNKRPPIFTVNVKRNLPPKLDFEFPKRDVQVSAIQEMPVEGKVWDDVGVLKAGVTFAYGDETRELNLADAKLDGGKNHPLKTLFAFEEIGAEPRDFVTYHLWAEDIGPDGKPRRAQSDMFFAEVREFEDIFREQEAQGGQPGEQQQGGAAAELMKLQKDVINANWQILRRYQMGRKIEELLQDVEVVRESQQIAISQTDAAIEEAEDAELKAIFDEAKEHMANAVQELTVAIEKPDGSKLDTALKAEKDAYGALVKARNREHNVTRSQNQQQSQGQGQEQQQQLMELEMKQKNLRYEEQRMAEEAQPQTAEQKENLEVLNKLKELARRQEAIAKKIKELETALQEAETEEEKSELERQLKRLQEEQEQLLRELDEVTEKMDSEQNRANMSEEREKLEETRDSVKDAAKNLEEGNLADAANDATRAQREMEEVKEDFRKKTSRQFSEEMRELRGAARELAEAQESIGKELDKTRDQNNPFEATPADNLALSREIDAQKEKLEEMLNKMREISEQSEESEPLLSDALYEGVREAVASGAENSLDEASQLTRYNRREMAREPERDAARSMEKLQEDVEKAAERVLGSEADALRLARSELDDLIEKSQAEAESLRNRQNGNESPEAGEEAGDQLAMNNAEQNRGQQRPGNTQDEGEEGEPSESGKGNVDSPREGEEPQSGEGSGDNPKGEKGQNPKGENTKGKGEGNEKGEQPSRGEGKGEKGEKGKGKGKGSGQGTGEGEPQLAQNGEEQSQSPQPGPGEGKGQGKSNAKSDGGKGEGKGSGQGKGGNPTQPQLAENGQPSGPQPDQEGEGRQGSQPGKGKGKGEGKGENGKGKGQGQSKGGYRSGLADSGQQQQQQPPSNSGNRNAGGGGPNWGGGNDRRNGPPTGGSTQAGQPFFFNRPEDAVSDDPITGEGYEDWANRLGNIEEMLEQDDLRNEVAKVLDDARAMRIDYRRDNLPPQANAIDTRITNPLVELRNQLTEELAKLDKENPLAPIDRDPVPGEFRELVKKYYEELGSGE